MGEAGLCPLLVLLLPAVGLLARPGQSKEGRVLGPPCSSHQGLGQDGRGGLASARAGGGGQQEKDVQGGAQGAALTCVGQKRRGEVAQQVEKVEERLGLGHWDPL